MTTTFGALGIAPDLVAALARDGITEPFPVQRLTIPDALARRDVCGKARTGSGKTLAFGLPILEILPPGGPKSPSGVVLVPTRELAAQVHGVIAPLAQLRGVRIALCYGGTPLDRQIKALARGVDLVVATPGRLIDLVKQGAVSLGEIKMVVVDEADRMNDMGFRPQVEWLLRHCTAKHQTLLFSATLDGQVDSLVEGFLHDPVRHDVDEEITIETMTHRFIGVHQLDKPKLTAAVANAHGRALVFVRTKRNADRVASRLREQGVAVAAIHGDRSQPQRERALAKFMQGKIGVLVATDVAARGIHVDAIDAVIHYDPPEDHKTYLHRSGRTARAGDAGLVVTLVLWDQQLDAQRLQKRLGLDIPIVEMLSNDPRLADLTAWDPSAEAAA